MTTRPRRARGNGQGRWNMGAARARRRTSVAGVVTPRASWERERLRWGVLEEPDEDAPRLVLADWLEEDGEDGLAGFIRGQVAAPLELSVGGLHAGAAGPIMQALAPLGLADEVRRLAWLGVEVAVFR